MNFTYNVITREKGRYLEIVNAQIPLETEQQALDLMSLCVENETNLLMVHAPAISENFFRLSTGAAGGILQKLINYHITAAFVLNEEMVLPQRFQEMMLEANKGGQYRFYSTTSEAEQWLLSSQEKQEYESAHNL